MTRETRHFTATIPAGTPISAPVLVHIASPARTVRQIDWRVPNGPMGVFGWQLSMQGVQVLPTPGINAGDKYVIANNEHGTWYPDGAPDTGDWTVTGYNIGASPHSVYLTFHLDIPSRAPELRAPLDFTRPPFTLDLSRAGPPL